MVAEEGKRPRPVLQEDRMHTETYDCIISAIGQAGDFSFLPRDIADQLDQHWGKFEVDQRQRTTVGKIFIGGDIANSVADAISAIADGKNAAIGIDDFIKHVSTS
jgi:glutamate synthase (NADPH/NADH) small chain